jgi:signal transduction histidine kinase
MIRAEAMRVHLAGERLASAAWATLLGVLVCLNAAAIPAIYVRLASPPPAITDVLVHNGLSIQAYALYMAGVQAVFGLICLAAAVAVWWQLPTQPFPRFVAVLLVLCTAASPPNLQALVATFPAVEPLARLAQILFLVELIAFPFLFPTGRFVPSWMRTPVWLLVLTLAVTAVALGGSLSDPPDPIGALTLLGLVGGLAAMVYRYARRSDSVARQQTKWVVASGVVVAVVTVLDVLLLPLLPLPVPAELRSTPYDPVSVTVMSVAYALLPVSIGLAILRYRLWDIDVVINRALVYGALSAGLLGLYLLVVAGVGEVVQTQSSGAAPLIATLAVAICIRPLHARIQYLVNRVLYGDRDDPYVALARLGQQLEFTLTPNAVLPTVVHGITEALRVPHAALEVCGSDGLVLRAATGTVTEPRLRLPVSFQNETLGELSVSPRAPGEPFSASDRRLLQDLTRQAGVAAHAVLLAADLERSRLKLVLAREDARRRLGSDLHDGLGHRLAGLLRAAERLAGAVEADPPVVRRGLDELGQQTRAAIQEVRELAHRLHPPELELYGLVGSLREQAERYSSPTTDGLRVSVEADADLPPLPVAVESAAYLIACEALANVERHSGASQCCVRVTMAPPAAEDGLELSGATSALHIDIIDNGRVMHSEGTGLGLTSMRQRAAELGGRCSIEAAQPHGTRVRVRLPCLADG